MSELKSMAKQSSHYFFAAFIVTVSGFISFPIFTRVFTVAEYGVLNLISSTLMVMVAISKFGIQTAALRFFGEYKSGKRDRPIIEYYSTLLFGTILFAGMITALYWIAVNTLIIFKIGDNEYFKLLSFSAILIFLNCVINILMNFVRADQNTKMYNAINIISKYSSLALSLVFVLYFMKNLYGFFFGGIISQVIIAVFLIYVFAKKGLLSFKHFSPSLLKESIKYGLPLISFELAAILLAYADRFMIQYYMNSDAVGLYSAGYNLAQYVGSAVIVPLELAIVPIYMSMWVEKTPEEVKAFLAQTLKYFMLFSIPVIFGLSFLGKELISFVASAKYIESYKVIPYVISGFLIYGTYNIFAAGLFIRKKTILVSSLIVVASIVNILLNIVFIPVYGISGSAFATLLTYIIFTVLVIIYSFKYLKFKIDYISMIRYTAASCLMLLSINQIALANKFLSLSVKIGVASIVYCSLVVLTDPELRNKIGFYVKQFRSA